jgi:hypothetical protein
MSVVSQLRKELYEIHERGGAEKWVPIKHVSAVLKGMRIKCTIVKSDDQCDKVLVRMKR